MSEWYEWAYQTKSYLHDMELKYQEFSQEKENTDHVHCEICWAKFAETPEAVRMGYYEPVSKSWICPECYAMLNKLFRWRISASECDPDG